VDGGRRDDLLLRGLGRTSKLDEGWVVFDIAGLESSAVPQDKQQTRSHHVANSWVVLKNE